MAETSTAPWPPARLDDALAAELSATTRRALEAAGAMAANEASARGAAPVVGLRALIGGLVTVGEMERGSPLIAGALVEALETLVGPERIAANRAPTETRGSATGLPLSPRASDALAAARLLAERTGPHARIAARHLWAALIAPPEAPLLSAALRRIWQRDWDIDPQVLRAPLLAAMEANPGASEDLGAWRAILGETVLAAAAFTPDAPQTDDALNRRGDARRLAELACLKDNAPPLAIGLFGDWGSGKSTFMAMMHQEVERIGRDWRAEANTPFVTNVAQIRFNAWSFSDANLWASLAVEIFGGLRDEVARIEGTTIDRGDALLAEITGRAELAKASLETAKRAAEDARRAIAALDRQIAALDTRLAEQAQRGAAGGAAQVLATRGEQVTETLRALGVIGPSEAATATALAAEAAKLRAAGSGTLAVGRRLVALMRPRAGRMTVLSVAAAAGAVVVTSWLLPSVVATLAGLVAFAAPLAAHAAQAVAALAPILDAAEAEAKAEADLRAERERLVAEREVASARLAAREAETRAAVAQIESLDRAAATPGAMLRFFLSESDELKAYEKESGLIGRLRRSFERLDRLMAAQADPQQHTRSDLPTIERIILYIDDLDRLREEQVVKVLEAVALLLQFRLFVVVVAVDERWLRGALQTHYGKLFENGAGPSDYLEKIFQVPFWLPRLGPGDPAFAGLARALMPEGVAPPDGQPSGTAPGASAFPPLPAVREAQIDPAERSLPGDETPTETRAATAERVTLTKDEAEVLAALMPLAADTPRDAKRFVNLYRLARASRSGDALRRFLGGDGDTPEFAAFALALACEIGLSGPQLRLWREALGTRPTVPLNSDSPLISVLAADRWKPLWDISKRAQAFWGRFNKTLRFADVAPYLPEARRYSFHPPQVDESALPPEAPPEATRSSPA
ncbi:P-loop NTPase fold protein [Elioraea sp.]|uniref:P-loop NTPase fold protein n=1 Tax=Elioraea sp. TaxID=2185103 RepID=UPI00307FCE1C